MLKIVSEAIIFIVYAFIGISGIVANLWLKERE
jgi:hypothetical protein